MKALRITSCSDGHMWYAKLVGGLVAYVGEYENEYISKEPAGYKNIVLKTDAEVVDVTEEEWTLEHMLFKHRS